MADLSVEFAGLKLPSPLFVGSGPNTRKAKESIAALKAGAGLLEYGFLGGKPSHEYERGVDQMWILPSKRDAFQNRFFGYASTGYRRKWHQKASSLEYRMEVLSEIKKATKGLGAVVSSIGLVNYRYRPEPGFLRWGEMAKYSEEAGADAVILHLQTGQELAGKILTEDQDYLRDIIREVKGSCHIPVIAKLPIEGCDPTFLSALALNFGADAVAPTARYVGLHIDLDTGTVPEW